MLTDNSQRRARGPVATYLSQPDPPPNREAPGRGADLPPGPRLPRLPSAAYTALGFWSRRIPFFEQCRARYGTPFTLWMRLPPVPLVWFDDPEHVKAIFQAPADVLHAGNGSFELEHFFGRTGLAFMEEDEHLARRKVVNRSTHGEELQRINEAMREIAAREVAAWPRDEPFHTWPFARRVALKSVFQVCFGDDRDERVGELLDVVERMMAFNDNPVAMLSTQQMPTLVVRALAAYPPFRRFLAQRARADRLIYDLIADRRRSGEAGGMLGILLAASGDDGSPLPAVEIRDEIMTTFLAGNATTTSGICWGIEQLARDRDARERIRAEIAADGDEPYLTAFVCELLRRKPPLPSSIPRTVMKPFELDGRVYPAGTRLVVANYLLHHNPAVYPDPYAFRPERFLERPPGLFSWTPFGGGRRKCLGKAIGENEIAYVLREVLSRYELHAEGARAGASEPHLVVLKPVRRVRLTLSAQPASAASVKHAKMPAVTNPIA
jgi:cytochrome P450 family 135